MKVFLNICLREEIGNTDNRYNSRMNCRCRHILWKVKEE